VTLCAAKDGDESLSDSEVQDVQKTDRDDTVSGS